MEDPHEALESVKTEVVTQIRSHVLKFLNETLPNIQIPDVGNVQELPAEVAARAKAEAEAGSDGAAAAAAAAPAPASAAAAAAAAAAEQDGGDVPAVKFRVAGMKISPGEDLAIQEEDIDVAFGDLLAAEEGDVLTVTTTNIGATMQGLGWMYELTSFPYLFGDGLARVDLERATIRIAFKLERKPAEEGGFFASLTGGAGAGDAAAPGEAQLVVSSSHISIDVLSLSIRESNLSWIYNALLWLAEGTIKDAVLEAVNGQLTGNIAEALRPINDDERVRKGMGMLLEGLAKSVKRASTTARRVSAAAPLAPKVD
jgi:hypothetical protein